MSQKINTRMITIIAVFSAMAIILYVVPVFQFRLDGVFPFFLEFHFDEVPIMIAGYAFGPIQAFWITLIKTLVKLPQTKTLMVGEIADFLYTLALVLPASIFYRKQKSRKGFLISLGLGFVCQLIVSSLGNSLFIIDFYLALFNMQSSAFLATLQSVNPLITDLKVTLTLFGILPFNIFKNIIVVIITAAVFRRISPFIKSKEEIKKSDDSD